MAAGDYRMGLNGLFYYGTAGSQAATEADNVDGVSLNLAARKAEAVRRGKDWVANKPTVLEATLEFKVFDIEADTFLSALKTAFMTKARIALYPTDGTSGEGLDADYYVSALVRSEGNEEFITYAVTAVPTDELRDPTWT
jgi:hypothetical protein